MRFAVERLKQVLEPAGSAALAATLAGRIPIRDGERVAVVLSGGNVEVGRIGELLASAGTLPGSRLSGTPPGAVVRQSRPSSSSRLSSIPRWWASSWRTVAQTSSASSSGSAKSASSGSRNRVIRLGNGAQSAPHSVLGTPSYRPYRVSSGLDLVLPDLLVRRLVGDHDRDLVEGGRERLRDRRQRLIDQHLEPVMVAGSRPGSCCVPRRRLAMAPVS